MRRVEVASRRKGKGQGFRFPGVQRALVSKVKKKWVQFVAHLSALPPRCRHSLSKGALWSAEDQLLCPY